MTPLLAGVAVVAAAQVVRALTVGWTHRRTRRVERPHPPGAWSLAAVGARVEAWAPVRWLVARVGTASYDRGLALGLEAAGRHLRAGAAIPDAVGEAARVAGGAAAADLRGVAERVPVVGLRAALAAWVEHRPTASVRLAAAVLSVGFRTGGATARALDGVADAVRQRLAVADEARSLTAQARLSAHVLGVAPAVFAVVVSAIDPRVASFLVTTPAGLVLLAAGLTLDAAGIVWMRRLVRATLR